MASQDVLKEFLVAIGFSVDHASQKRAFEQVQAIEKGLLGLAAAATTATIGVVAGLERMAATFEKSYYASSRTGSSIQAMNAFKYAMSQMGSSAEEAQSTIDNLGQAIRKNPGIQGVLKQLGATDPTNVVKSLNDIAPRLASMPIHVAEGYAQMLQIPENTLLAMRRFKEMYKNEGDENTKYGLLGFSPDKFKEDAHKLTSAFRGMYDTISAIAMKVASGLFKDLQPQIERLNQFMVAHGKELTDSLIDMGKAAFKIAEGILKWASSTDGAKAFLAAISDPSTWATIRSSFDWFVGQLHEIERIFKFLAKVDRAVWGDPSKPSIMDHLMGTRGAGPGTSADPQALANGPYADVQEESGAGAIAKRAWRNRPKWLGGNGSGGPNERHPRPGKIQPGGWWTPERQRHAFDVLTQNGVSERGAIALISRWKNVESHNRGPDDLNPLSGAYGIEQGLGPRKPKTNDFDAQLRQAAEETRNAHGMGAGRIFDNAKTDAEAARGASVFERAEGWNGRTDNFAGTTEAGMESVRRAIQQGKDKTPPIARPAPALPPKSPLDAFGTLNPEATRAIFVANPLGAYSAVDHSRTVTMHASPNITVNGVSDPTAAAGMVGARMDKSHSMLLKNVQSALK